MRFIQSAVLVPMFALIFPATVSASTVQIWTRFEAQFTSSAKYENAIQDVQVNVEFTSPSGKKHSVQAFWDGGATWKVRFSPDETGRWSYRSSSSNTDDKGLDNQSGEFTCAPYAGDNPLYRRGAIRVSDDHRYLVHADGTPFLWLSDTAWNGALKSDAESWERYLEDRGGKGFTAIQFV
ncbi:MAG TPA: DUF5060 domain-containing protein, partial [Terriglobia bacterium]|nr:DUF5060 domain-containing protein [Terriglobia bacterium]